MEAVFWILSLLVALVIVSGVLESAYMLIRNVVGLTSRAPGQAR
jgi:hypothetical protein